MDFFQIFFSNCRWLFFTLHSWCRDLPRLQEKLLLNYSKCSFKKLECREIEWADWVIYVHWLCHANVIIIRLIRKTVIYRIWINQKWIRNNKMDTLVDAISRMKTMVASFIGRRPRSACFLRNIYYYTEAIVIWGRNWCYRRRQVYRTTS